MNPAQKIVERFGGQTALAKLIGRGQSTVFHWTKTGVIPARWQPKLLDLARSHNISLSPADFLPNSDSEAPSPTSPLAPPSPWRAVPSAPKVKKREAGQPPEAKWWGDLVFGDVPVPCYVLDDGRRIISRTGATSVLTSKKGGGNLDSYLRVKALQDYLPEDLPGQLIEFTIENVVNKTVQGMEAETFLEICRAYAKARDAGALETEIQTKIAIQANMVLMACAKIGLIALIDEATGYQYDRAEDALQFKLRVYLAEEMRKWERTFPEELWQEFARLTNWKGSIHQRPKYWGKLVMELVYDYLDKDVADWLRDNAPPPCKGQNYHQHLSEHFGLKKLIEHVWMLIGMSRACYSLPEVRERMAEHFGRQPVQLRLFLPPPK